MQQKRMQQKATIDKTSVKHNPLAKTPKLQYREKSQRFVTTEPTARKSQRKR